MRRWEGGSHRAGMATDAVGDSCSLSETVESKEEDARRGAKDQRACDEAGEKAVRCFEMGRNRGSVTESRSTQEGIVISGNFQ